MTEVISLLNLVAMEMPGGEAEGGSSQIIIMVVGMGVLFYFLMYRPEKKKREERQKTLDALERGTEVVTAGGIYGKITAMTDTTITLEVANNTKIKFSRQHITGPVSKEEAGNNSKKKK
jgi:preprotein translocase subunit YajC